MREFSPEIRLNEKNYWLVSCALVTGMLTCAALTLLSVINRVLPGWQPWYLAGLVFFVSFERLYTYRRFNQLDLFSKAWASSLAAEWIVILALVKVTTGLSHGLDQFLAETRYWLAHFGSGFLSNDFLFATGLVLAAWLLSSNFAELLDEMGLRQAIIRLDAPVAPGATLQPAREQLLGQIINLGAVLIVLTALVRVDLRAVLDHSGGSFFIQLPALAGGGASTLLYFMFGLALFSQTQFIDLHTRWNLLRLPVDGQIARRWALYSLVFFGILAIAVACLPTSYSLGFLGVLGLGLGFVYGALFVLSQAILSLLLLIVSLLSMLFGFKSPIQSNPLGAPQVQTPIAKLPPTVPVAWLELLKSLAFWAALVAILVFALVQYLRQHQEVLDALGKFPLFKLLARFWNWLSALSASVRTGVSKIVTQGLVRLRPRSEADSDIPLGSFLSLRRLDARQKIMFFYLALLRRGGASGLTRQASQTPHEYARALDAALPGVEPEIDSLTEAFIEARYSPHPVPGEQVKRVKDYWERIKKALRGKLKRKS